MSRAVMLSIRPEWCELIASGRKKVEVRKTRPKILPPFRCYIYETQGKTETPWMDEDGHMVFRGRGQVIGEFVCDWCDSYDTSKAGAMAELVFESLIPPVELLEYMGSKKTLYGWHISDLVIYDTPKTLQELGTTMPPQSWRYVEEDT